MFKKTDPNPQLDIFTAPSMQLGSRASKKYSAPNAWHNQFYSLVTTRIDEEIIPKEPRNQCLKMRVCHKSMAHPFFCVFLYILVES